MNAAVARDIRVNIRLAGPQDARWITRAHGRLYRVEAGFGAGFEPLVAQVLAGFFTGHDAACERGWIVMRKGRRAGSLFCTRHMADTARLRLFLLLPACRGQGLGRALLGQAAGFARDAGYARLEIATYDRHRAAGRLYAAAGFTLERRVPVLAFGHEMEEQLWRIAL